MNRRIVISSILVLLLSAAPAHAAWKEGERCKVDKSFRVTAKPRNRGKKSRIDAGTELTVVGVGKGSVRVSGGGIEGFVPEKALTRKCRKLGDDGSEDAPEPELPPLEAPDGGDVESEDPTDETIAEPDPSDTTPSATDTGPGLTEISAEATDGGAPPSFPEEGQVSGQSVGMRIRWLGDRLANGLERMPGQLRYQRIAVLPFEEAGPGVRERELGLLVSAELTTALRRDHGVVIIERAQLKSVLDELALGQTGVVEPSQAVEVGKLSGAQGLVIGSVADAGDSYRVSARVVAVEDGQIVYADDVGLPAADLVALSAEAVVLRTRAGALYRSALIPGWGQLYNREPVKSGVFLGAELATIAAAFAMHLRGADFERRYDKLGAGTDPLRFERVLDRAESAYGWRNRLIFVAIGIHAVNALDAFLSGYDGS